MQKFCGSRRGFVTPYLFEMTVEFCKPKSIAGRFDLSDGGFELSELSVSIEHIIEGTSIRGRGFLSHMGNLEPG